MFAVALSSVLAFAAVASAQDPPPQFCTPALYDMHFNSPADLPEKVITSGTIRGPQTGISICNSTTENQQSMCQVSRVNSPGDFCLWGPPQPNSTIADTEGEEVVWCSAKGHGTRLMPDGTLKGMTYLETPDYIMIRGLIQQESINIQTGDFGGELDPHGADLCGNAIGGTMFSTIFDKTGGTEHQVPDWTQFIGNDAFCVKICNPNSPNKGALCENRYDRIGLDYNCPAPQVQEGVFVSCQADNMTPVGTYVTNGVTTTWTQPPESLGAITSIPYTPVVPATSNCVTLTSANLFTGLPSATAVPGSSAASSGASSAPTGSPSGTGSKASSTASRTSSSSAGTPTGGSQNSGAGVLQISVFATVFGTVVAAIFLS